MNDSWERLRYFCYRCETCGRLITRLEILAIWDKMEAERATVAWPICPCGSKRFRPTNPSIWEQLFLPRVWKLWWKEVRGKELPPLYRKDHEE